MKWEYMVDYAIRLGGSPDIRQFEEHLNGRGEEGWELAFVFPKTYLMKTNGEEIWLIYKRAIPPKSVTG